MKELVFIAYAGFIRGAVSFGLVLKIDENLNNRAVIVTTCLTLVMFSTIVFGSTVITMSKFFFKREPSSQRSYSLISGGSKHEESIHPNFAKSIT